MGDLVGEKQIEKMLYSNGGYLEILSLTEELLNVIKTIPYESNEFNKLHGNIERIKEIAENNFKNSYSNINPINHLSTHSVNFNPNNSMKDYEKQIVPSPSRIKFNKSESIGDIF